MHGEKCNEQKFFQCFCALTFFLLQFLLFQWGSQAFKNMRIIPPGSGIIHQVNLEYLARVVMDQDGYYYPDSVVGTDSHTTMIDGLGVLGWGMCLAGVFVYRE